MREKRGKKKQNWFVRMFIPWKGDRAGDIALKLVSIAALIAFVVSAGYLGNYYWESYQNRSKTDNLVQLYKQPQGSNSAGADSSEAPPMTQEQKFAALLAENPDTAGWVEVPGTGISLPVVQAKDNDYYLRRDFYGDYDKYGTAFLDYRNTLDPNSTNTVIYSHNMKDGRMFGELMGYEKLDFYKAHPVFTFDTPKQQQTFKVFAVFVATTEAEYGEVFNYHDFIQADSEETFNSFIAEVNKRNLLKTAVDVQYGDELATLSTCTYEFNRPGRAVDARLVVMGRKVRQDESAEVDVSAASLNGSALMPDIWYEINNTTKPS